MKVLVGCEFSGIVRDAFLARGHDAFSCDFLETESPGPHYQGDVQDLLHPGMWDLIIMHPDCTALCNAGNRHYGEGKEFYYERLAAARWTANLWARCRLICKRVCFENPPGVLESMAGLPPAQFIQPYMFGHPEQKRTGLHLHGLPDLEPTNWVHLEMMNLTVAERERVFHMGPSPTRWMDRARTFTGIADAMAEQWGNL